MGDGREMYLYHKEPKCEAVRERGSLKMCRGAGESPREVEVWTGHRKACVPCMGQATARPGRKVQGDPAQHTNKGQHAEEAQAQASQGTLQAYKCCLRLCLSRSRFKLLL